MNTGLCSATTTGSSTSDEDGSRSFKSVCERIDALGESRMVLRPGFEPGSPARKAGILDRAIFGRVHLLPEPFLEHYPDSRFSRIKVST